MFFDLVENKVLFFIHNFSEKDTIHCVCVEGGERLQGHEAQRGEMLIKFKYL